MMQIHPSDNVAVDLETGHKVALAPIRMGEAVIKYGFPIGTASADIAPGERVHTHNLRSALGGAQEYRYTPDFRPIQPDNDPRTFLGYRRGNGAVGIRNEIWIIPTVGCVNRLAETLAQKTGAHCFTHPFGCSQLGDDMRTTQLVLKGLVGHPNAGGVLVVGLGCENNHLGVFQKILGEWDPDRVQFLNAQEEGDEVSAGLEKIAKLQAYADSYARVACPLSDLRIGLKCGGSDGFSGLSANPLVGRVCDKIIAAGGGAALGEVPEMFGAETILMRRCVNRDVFDKLVQLVNGFKTYFVSHGQPVSENPSPGNQAGGITTLEEKSLGCVQKGGTAPVIDVLDYGDTMSAGGLNLVNTPGNDLVSMTNLTAAGAQMILFTTGRGTPAGAPVPTVKISTNSALFARKPAWIDFDAGAVLRGEAMDSAAERLFDLCLAVASGQETRNEIQGYREISIFKDGVTL